MDETEKIWMNGKFVNWKNANTHVLTHSLHYGVAVFEGVRFYETPKGPAIFRLKEHTKRLFQSAKDVGMKLDYSENEIEKATIQTVKVNKIKSGYIRPIIYHGYGKMGLNPTGAPLEVVIACWPWGKYLGDNPIKDMISRYIRIHPKSTKAASKISGHYVNSILANMEAKNNGFDEALLLDFNGDVAEGPGENIFIVENKKVITPKAGNILIGITRDSVMKIAKDLGFEVKEEIITPERLKKADEIFFTGTAAEVTPIASIDKTIIGNGKMGPVTNMIKEKFMRAVEGKEDKYKDWLSIVN